MNARAEKLQRVRYSSLLAIAAISSGLECARKRQACLCTHYHELRHDMLQATCEHWRAGRPRQDRGCVRQVECDVRDLAGRKCSASDRA